MLLGPFLVFGERFYSISVLTHLCVRNAVTGVLVSQAALTLLEEDTGLEGGIYTGACLGQPFIDRLSSAGFHLESKILDN
jgi:short subunit dehydrogenase-like uncharacterized protein